MTREKPTKATSKAERKRRRKRTISLPGGQEIATRTTQGRRTDMEHRRSDDTAALTARTRRFGYPDSPEGRKAVSGPEFGCAVGVAIMADKVSAGERSDLWQAVCHMRRVWLAYDRAIGAPSRHAKCLAVLTPVDAMTADAASPALDMRAPEDRDRQAVAAYMTLRGWLGHVDGAAQSAAICAVVDEPEGDVRQWPAVKRALLCVVDGIKGLPIKARITTTA